MILYFAYGSNLDADQMARRCPAAIPHLRAHLADHRLMFRGPSRRRGRGVATVDPAPGSRVEGLLWRLGDADLTTLDRLEGAPQWYLRTEVTVVGAEGARVRAVTYRLPLHVTVMGPTTEYFDQIVQAYAQLTIDAEPLHAARRASEQAGNRPAGADRVPPPADDLL